MAHLKTKATTGKLPQREQWKWRLISIVENLASQPSTSVPQASGNLAAASATYDFWNSPYFHPSDIIAAQAKSTVERIKEHPIVLAVQDTTSLDFTTQKAKKGMGYLDCKTSFVSPLANF